MNEFSKYVGLDVHKGYVNEAHRQRNGGSYVLYQIRWRSSRRPDTQGETGSATTPMIPRVPRMRVAVKVGQNRPLRGDAEIDQSA
jgi:hypothetical protein